MANVKYTYDYPVNRTIGRSLGTYDMKLIAEKTGLSFDYVVRILKMGTRTNDDVIKYAKRLNNLKKRL